MRSSASAFSRLAARAMGAGQQQVDARRVGIEVDGPGQLAQRLPSSRPRGEPLARGQERRDHLRSRAAPRGPGQRALGGQDALEAAGAVGRTQRLVGGGQRHHAPSIPRRLAPRGRPCAGPRPARRGRGRRAASRWSTARSQTPAPGVALEQQRPAQVEGQVGEPGSSSTRLAQDLGGAHVVRAARRRSRARAWLLSAAGVGSGAPAPRRRRPPRGSGRAPAAPRPAGSARPDAAGRSAGTRPRSRGRRTRAARAAAARGPGAPRRSTAPGPSARRELRPRGAGSRAEALAVGLERRRAGPGAARGTPRASARAAAGRGGRCPRPAVRPGRRAMPAGPTPRAAR